MNDIMYTGPKLERELVEVLVRFRRFPVALVCDVAQMYLYISIAPKAQQYHQFLWKDLNQNKVPDHYEFNSSIWTELMSIPSTVCDSDTCQEK